MLPAGSTGSLIARVKTTALNDKTFAIKLPDGKDVKFTFDSAERNFAAIAGDGYTVDARDETISDGVLATISTAGSFKIGTKHLGRTYQIANAISNSINKVARYQGLPISSNISSTGTSDVEIKMEILLSEPLIYNQFINNL